MEKCKCKDCNKEFIPFNFTEDCYNCEDGEVEMEMEWEYEPSMYTCSHCGGTGSITSQIKTRCKVCYGHYVYEDYES